MKISVLIELERLQWSSVNLHAFNGRGTPPTNTVLRGSNDIEASKTKSASDKRHGRIWTGLFLMVGDETQMYSLSSSMMQFSIKFWTEHSSCLEKEDKLKIEKLVDSSSDERAHAGCFLAVFLLVSNFRSILIQFPVDMTSSINRIEILFSHGWHFSAPNAKFFCLVQHC